ncbi:hypothetical protein [Candidatus Nitrosocosmicus franklandus]|uniref:Uncharacterized protein n=1 Tax=Candidatus Nitrosocosmicus franklandianus TaxID=1798806 RepID=A0A484IBX2_9ARCH|nr:hypothetical protein [Candidatus Nitrosocosmicus franklandus]VFJ13160.1 conserved protein of unknown function [Candidatus Nitrosocosmicus franklandus]
MDLITYRKLKESGYKKPNLTTVIHDPEMILGMYLESLSLPENELNILWNQQMFDFIVTNLRETFIRIEKLSRTKGIKFRIVVELSEDNKWFLKSITYCEVRQTDAVPENLQLIDTKIYLQPVIEPDGNGISKILWSNSVDLVNQKQNQFDKLWKTATPTQ